MLIQVNPARGDGPWDCKECRRIVRLTRAHHNFVYHERKFATFECTVCGAMDIIPEGFAAHMRFKHDQRVSCEKPDWKAMERKYGHMVPQGFVKLNSCPYCVWRHYDRDAITEHMRTCAMSPRQKGVREQNAVKCEVLERQVARLEQEIEKLSFVPPPPPVPLRVFDANDESSVNHPYDLRGRLFNVGPYARDNLRVYIEKQVPGGPYLLGNQQKGIVSDVVVTHLPFSRGNIDNLCYSATMTCFNLGRWVEFAEFSMKTLPPPGEYELLHCVGHVSWGRVTLTVMGCEIPAKHVRLPRQKSCAVQTTGSTADQGTQTEEVDSDSDSDASSMVTVVGATAGVQVAVLREVQDEEDGDDQFFLCPDVFEGLE